MLQWNLNQNKKYSTGIDHVTLFKEGKNPVAWDGVTAVNESPSGAEVTKIYADNIHYLSLISKEEFACTIECYSTPEAFNECNGLAKLSSSGIGAFIFATAQARKSFTLAYRVANGDGNTEATNGSYTYHFVFGCKAGVSSRDHATINDSPEAATLSYEISTTPITEEVEVGDDTVKYTASHIEVEIAAEDVEAFETALLNDTKFTTDAITIQDILDAYQDL